MTDYLSYISSSKHKLVQTPLTWLRPLIVIGTLLFSLVIALKSLPSSYMMVLIGLVPGIIAVLILLRWPALGLILVIVAGMVSPYNGPSGLTVSMVLVATLLGLWIMDILVKKRELRLAPSRMNLPILSFVVVSCISFGVGQLPWFTFAQHAPLGAQLAGLTIFVLSAGAFFLVANQVRDLRWLKALTWAFVALVAVYTITIVIPGLIQVNKLVFQSTGSLLWVWFVALTISQAAFNKDLHGGWRVVLGTLTLVSLYMLTVQRYDDKSGWVPAFIAIGAIIWFRSWRVGLVLTLLAIIPGWQVVSDALVSDEYSVSTRLDALIIVIEIVKASPAFGLGFANYYWFTPLFPIRGWAVQFNSHNNYVDIIAQTGLLGLVCVLWFFVEAGVLCLQLRDRQSDGFARAYVYGAAGGLVGTVLAAALGDWVLPFFYNIGLTGYPFAALGWLFLGGLVCLEQMAKHGPLENHNSEKVMSSDE